MLRQIILCAILLLAAAPLAAQTPGALTAGALQPGGTFQANNEVVIGARAADDDNESAKFHQYRDLVDGLYLHSLRYLLFAPATARFFEATGSNVGRDDQSVTLRGGRYGTWTAVADWQQLPHRLSNHAFSPYTYQGGGVFTVPGVVGILTTTADNVNFLPADMLENDSRIAAYLGQNLHQLPQIGTQRDGGSLFLQYAPTAALEARLTYAIQAKEGQRISFGPIGDRPPRTLNVQLPEPVDYDSRTLQLDFGWATRSVDVQLEILVPEFRNDIDTMRWQNMFVGPDSDGATDYNNDVILAGNAIARRAVSTFGQRALAPDSDYQNATLTFGAAGPMRGRFTGTVALGTLDQDANLLPYSYSSLTKDWNSLEKLPRGTAAAEMTTTLVDLQYTFNPTGTLRIRPFFRSYDLENDTPSAQWQYVTQDTAGTSGTVSYKNKRINVAYGYDRQNLGVETSWRVRALNLGLTLENESYGRDFRETDTDELIARFRAAFRPASWLALSGRYTFADRDSGRYDWTPGSQSYWYAQSEVNDTDNPALGFVNHPDMRRSDVSDRARNDFDISATITPAETLAFSVSLASQSHDFDSDVQPVQPLAGRNVPGAPDVTLGTQLGLLGMDATILALDANWTPSERWSLSVFGSLDDIELDQKDMAYNEATRIADQDAVIANPGQAWNDARSIWRAVSTDNTSTVGIAGTFSIIPERLELVADYTYSDGSVEIDYSGYGSDKPLDTTYYGWRSPEDVQNTNTVANLGLQYKVRENLEVGVNYLFDDFDTTDWMQEPIGGWVEEVGSDFFLRDTTRDNRWGNRLVRMGDYLAPAYSGNSAYITIAFAW